MWCEREIDTYLKIYPVVKDKLIWEKRRPYTQMSKVYKYNKIFSIKKKEIITIVLLTMQHFAF